jgi:GNAT superfamily N-acetyltransferase
MEKIYKIVEVNDRKTKKEFLLLPVRLYKNDKSYIRPLDQDIERIFDPRKNKYFRHGVCQRWILLDNKGVTVGRVAAFIDRKTAGKYDQPTGGMGFFECINDRDAAFMLFDQCKEWLAHKGMEAMDGPINFGERYQWWGLLIDGFTEPNYSMPYNFGYYRELFEAYGFQLYFKQYTYRRTVRDDLIDVVKNKADKVLQNPDYSFRHHDKSKIKQFTEDFRIVYNKGWARHTGVAQMSSLQARALFKKLKPIMEPNLLWFAYHKGDPVAFFLMLPELNQIFKYMNGKFHLFNKLRFLILKRRGVIKKMLGTIFGVIPEHQGKGVESAIVVAFSKVAFSPGFKYTELEMNWIGDFNPKMMKVAEQVGGKIYKTHHTYRYLFDRQKEFHRAPSID